MDKLDHYLDRVCRGIAGPRSLRQHIRQELREHLLDAIAERRAAGLSEEEALERALADFGGPDEVRSDLEATHGHRLMMVVVDKALQWKERTMKARWLWASGAHLFLAATIAIEVSFIWFAMLRIVPAYQKFRDDGLFETDRHDPYDLVAGSHEVLMSLVRIALSLNNYWFAWLIPLTVAWGAFEWRVRSENKSLMRLSALAIAALVTAVGVVLTATSLIVPFVFAIPNLYAREPEAIVRQEQAALIASVAAMEKARETQDWKAGRHHAKDALAALNDLSWMGAAAPAMLSLEQQPKVDQIRTELRLAQDQMLDAYNAILQQDAEKLTKAMKTFREAYDKAQALAK